MRDVADIRRREVKAFLSFVAGAETERAIDARTFHILAEFAHGDFVRLSEMFLDLGATASVAFLGRDADEQARTIEAIDDDGHEVALHGHRHVRFGSLGYETAHADLSRGLDAIEDATGVRAGGFFAPFKAVSIGTLEAVDELGLSWVLGSPDEGLGNSVDATIVDSVYPHDTRLLEGGTSPGETFEQLSRAATDGATFLFHPNLLEYYGATEEFEAWVTDVSPVSVGEQLTDGGVSVVLDCLRPLTLV